MSVCSGVRELPTFLPSALGSLSSGTNVALSSAGGGTARNCEGELIVNGVALRIHGACAGRNAGGVGTHWPRPPSVVNVPPALRPSSARSAMIRAATSAPTAMPSDLALPSGTYERDDASAASSAAWFAGYSASKASCPACATAAYDDACGERCSCNAYGSRCPSVAATAS